MCLKLLPSVNTNIVLLSVSLVCVVFQKMEHCILQNNAVDIYKKYYEDCKVIDYDPHSCAKIIATFRSAFLCALRHIELELNDLLCYFMIFIHF